jgi:hypothetical protein
VTSENKERSISPPKERIVSSNDDSMLSFVNANTNDTAEDSMRSLLNLNTNLDDEFNEHSMRSILNLDTDSIHSTDTNSTSDANSCNSHSKGGHRLSESHAPNRRFVQAATESLNRHIKMFEAKQQASTMFGPTLYRKGIGAKPFHNNPYDTSSTRDDSTTNDGSEGHDSAQPIQEASLLSSIPPLQGVKKVELSSLANNTPSKQIVELNSSTKRTEPSDITNDSFVWFKVSTGDVKEMTLANGVVVHVLRNAVKYDNHPDRARP